jgi:hypothetical protein
MMQFVSDGCNQPIVRRARVDLDGNVSLPAIALHVRHARANATLGTLAELNHHHHVGLMDLGHQRTKRCGARVAGQNQPAHLGIGGLDAHQPRRLVDHCR